MGQTLTNLIYRVVFSAKGRAPVIGPDRLVELPLYIAKLVSELGGRALTANATSDHVHLLISLPPKVSLSDAVKFIKANSSRWASQRAPAAPAFARQAGYAAFSVSQTDAVRVRAYTDNQAAHHREFDYQAELREILSAHDVEWDERQVWE